MFSSSLPRQPHDPQDSSVICKQRLGGLLKYYARCMTSLTIRAATVPESMLPAIRKRLVASSRPLRMAISRTK